MNQIYRSLSTSKQNFHQRVNRLMAQKEKESQLLNMMHQIRKDHPYMGFRHLFKVIGKGYIGRDRFREIYCQNGFKIKQKKNYRKTTDSSGVIRFENLLEQIEVTGVNQVWVSDITYYKIDGERFYYLTFIMDLYSRKIVGYSASKTLATTATTVPALTMALKNKSKQQIKGLIIHSDGGGQYYSKLFRNITENWNIKNSMAKEVYENPNAERVNRTIKQNYLKGYHPSNFQQLTLSLRKAVKMYNHEKPHDSLMGLTPVQYEKQHNQLTNPRIINLNNKNNSLLKTVNSI